jgi:hypothetical protein
MNGCCDGEREEKRGEKTTRASCAGRVSCCCDSVTVVRGPSTDSPPRWTEGEGPTRVGPVPRVSTVLSTADRWGAWKARWAIGRMRYRMAPGLYAVGRPTPESPVFVSANYKMSFDRLRSQLGERNGWILVLDTKGINVWCAAGKGTFGTDEIVRRVETVRLGEVVSHRTLVLPQLGAPGVSAHEVRRRSGFRVVYGPVRAEDLPAFLDAGMKARPDMRRVRFPLRSRLGLVPVEIVGSARYALVIAAGFLLLSGLGRDGYSTARAARVGLPSAISFLGAVLAAAVLVPALLPWLPGRSFSLKGAALGAVWAAVVVGYGWTHPGVLGGTLGLGAWLLMIPAVASFLAMNFTGASTFTSMSGVRREMRRAVPIQVASAVLGLGLWITGRFV